MRTLEDGLVPQQQGLDGGERRFDPIHGGFPECEKGPQSAIGLGSGQPGVQCITLTALTGRVAWRSNARLSDPPPSLKW
ncbi:hypothetical protein PtoMrB4_22440 [Metapseudomonas otitidis]|uniref:Uncharacterized protein n=1 Tax=Metapseudomonas otitidis TaxID=319939 RepID=A0A679GNL9_9GAMM|nr:hypothetical protein PtoMrB4_22440 [Pseudomonas otitidis]